MSLIVIDDNDKRPPYEQIGASIIASISAGSLESGARLAPIRQLAGDLGVAPNTVARAYRELEDAGYVVSRGRRGTVVAASAGAAVSSSIIAKLRAALDEAVLAGMTPDEISNVVAAQLD